MNRPLSGILLIPVLLFCFTRTTAQTVIHFPDPALKTESWQRKSGDTVWRLDHQFLKQESEQVWQDDRLLRRDLDYRVDYLHGLIVFLRPPELESTLTVTYRFVPISLPLSLIKWKQTSRDAADSAETDTTASVILKSAPVPGFESQLKRSGSIFRGISLGTDQGMRLQSGLRLQVSGTIADQVEIVASLTDQNTPIQPEGNTQTLQEIDKVLVTISAPGFTTTMGDYEFSLSGHGFGEYQRKLQGVSATVSRGKNHLTMNAAASRGKYTTNNFMGQEGNQGPYQLSGERGQRQIIVLAGTERVYVDGELMTRGEDNDYVIEYGNGQVTFTRKRLITADSRIRVEFEYSSQYFQKQVYGLDGEVNLLHDRLTINTAFLREADNKDEPLNFALSDDYLEILKEAGDDTAAAAGNGADFVGEGQGSYRAVDSLGTTIYHYVGAGGGDYTVRFSYLGSNKGDYSFQGYGIYRYEGGGKGSYLPVILLPMAVSQQAADVSSRLRLKDNLALSGSFSLSSQDANLFSTKDDEDNLGTSYRAGFSLDKQRLSLAGKGLGSLSLSGDLRNIGARFSPVGRMEQIEHGRVWGMPEGVPQGENYHTWQAVYAPVPLVAVETEFGTLSRSDGFDSRRQVYRFSLDRPDLPAAFFEEERISTTDAGHNDGLWVRRKGRVQTRWKLIRPALTYQGEHRRESQGDSVRNGFRYDELSASLLGEKNGLRLELSKTVRDQDEYDLNRLRDGSLAQVDQMKFSYTGSSSVSTSLLLTHRRRDYNDPRREDVRADLADLILRLTPGKRVFYGNIYYRYSNTRVSTMVRDTIQVGEGLGNYRLDEELGELVPDSDGDLLVRTLQTGDFEPVNNLACGAEFRLEGSRLGQRGDWLRPVLRSLTARSIFRVERSDRKQDFFSVNRSAFSPAWGADSTTVKAVVSLTQDLELAPPGSRYSLRLRLKRNDLEDHQLLYAGLIQRQGSGEVRLKVNPSSRLGINLSVLDESKKKEYDSAARRDRNIRSRGFLLDTSYRPRQKLELALQCNLRRARDAAVSPSLSVTSFFLVPRVGYAIKGKGKAQIEAELGRVWAPDESGSLPYEMLQGEQPGATYRWNCFLSYRVSDNVMATITYRGRREPWRSRIYHAGQMEVRAFF